MAGTNLWNIATTANGNVTNTKNVKQESNQDKRDDEITVAFTQWLQKDGNVVNKTSNDNRNDFNLNVSATDGKMNLSYDQYQYRDNKIQNVKPSSFQDKISESEDSLNEFEKDVIHEVAEKLDVDEQDVAEAMETLNMAVFDLLNPEKLGNLAMELTGENDATSLLVNENFQNLMMNVSKLGNELLDKTGIHLDEFQQIVARMESVDQQLPQGELETTPELNVSSTLEDIDTSTIQQVTLNSNEQKVNELGKETTSQLVNESLDDDQNQVQVNIHVQSETKMDSNGNEQDEPNQNLPKQETESVKQMDSQKNTTETVSTDVVLEPNILNQEPMTMPQVLPKESITSMDTMQIIQQIVDHVNITLGSDTTTMEMQLNPENLGKIYLHISAKEGAVTAQIATQNETVKEALQTQVAELQEKLTQAGVKVDAIEVTVASHEFEKNLEQNGQQEEQTANQQETMNSTRKNINLNDLDELSGLMSEEEELAAQIMKDNGNSVDLMA